ncbi:hypothetical protein RLDS_12175 [Sphingobium lactosutens DS20]|uniref:Uncharacterized protein n=1 Tax=Sphingobium lactosutens DS20 TaxID=1331060 RepID=T0ISX2_9SPHN|nr:hypothetical protein RLDS_12175 [Sphingobium lactosutens DS20]
MDGEGRGHGPRHAAAKRRWGQRFCTAKWWGSAVLDATDASMTMMGMEGYCELARDARISLLPDGGHAPCSGCRRDIGGEGIALMQVPRRREQIRLPAPADGAHDKARFTRSRIGAFQQGEIAAQGCMQQCLKIGLVVIGYRHDTSP